MFTAVSEIVCVMYVVILIVRVSLFWKMCFTRGVPGSLSIIIFL